jgi:hypothetical protein
MEQQFQHNQVLLVLDADEIAYQVAAACEQRGVVATNTTNEAQANFKHKTAFKDFTAGLEIPEGHFVLEETQIAEDPKNAFATVKAKINNLKTKFNTERVELYFSGKDNFRLNIPLPEQYKATRQSQLRPLLLNEVKDYLLKFHNAKIVEGDEADQMVAQRMWDGYKSGEMIVGCSLDKDARGNMGWLYNPDKDDLTYIDGLGELTKDGTKVRGHGRLWLYHQLCIGDWSTDHFCPRQIVKAATGVMPKFGETASYNLLKDCKSDKEAWIAVRDLYLKWFGSEQFSYTAWNGETVTTDYLGALQMIWDCAFMKRFDDDNVDVRAVLKKLGVIE